MAVHRAKKTPDKSPKDNAKKIKVMPDTPVSDAAMEKLARLMNDTPITVSLGNKTCKITALKPGTQWLIAEEACKIIKGENLSMGDVIKEFSTNLPCVARVIALAILNDKDRINGEEYNTVLDTLLWGDSDMRDWTMIIVEILNLIDVDFFFASTNAIQTIREQALGRKTQAAELSRQGLSTAR